MYPPSPPLTNSNLPVGITQNYLLHWDMGTVYDTSLNNSLAALNSMNYLFGLAFPTSYSNTPVTLVVAQFTEDFTEVMNFTASTPVTIGVSTQDNDFLSSRFTFA